MNVAIRKTIMGRFSQNQASLERRRDRRHEVAFPAWIDRGGLLPPVACQVKDLSISGARIELADNVSLPARFTLWLTREAESGCQCQMQWRQAQAVGVRFLNGGTIKAPA